MLLNVIYIISNEGDLTANREQENLYMTQIAELKEKLRKLEKDYGKCIIITSVHIDMSM